MGVVIFQMLADKIPPLGARTIYSPGGIFIEGCATIPEIVRATCIRVPPWHLLPQETSGLNSILRGMLSKTMQSRPSAPAVLEDAWFNGGSDTKGPQKIKGFHARATKGITRSFLASIE